MWRVTTKLAFAGLRRRRVQGALCVLVVAAATATLTVAVALSSVAHRPFDRTFEATNGAHVTVVSPRGGPQLVELERLPGVVGSTGLRPIAWSSFVRDGKKYGLRLIGIDSPPASPVARPLLVAGGWPREGEMVLERSFAAFHDLGVDASVETPRGRLVVSGIVVVAMGQAYPRSQPGLGLTGVQTLAQVVPDRSRWDHAIGLRIADPSATRATAAAVSEQAAGLVFVDTWLDERAETAALAHTQTVILSLFSAMLLLSAGAVLATLVSGRVVAQMHEIGALKATGLTPLQVSRVLVVEQVGLGVAGVVLGLVAGRLLTPLFIRPTAALLNASETPAQTPEWILAITALVLGLVALFTLVPGLDAARRTTAAILSAGRSGGARRSRIGPFVDRLGMPVSMGLGARGAFVRRGRTLLTALTLSLTVAAAVATLSMEASLDVATNPGVAPLIDGLDTPRFDPVDDDAGEADRLRPIVYGLDALLLFVGLVNLVATLLLTTRERVRDFGVLKAVGLTPRQVTGSVVSEQVVVAFIAGLLGVPLGLGMFRLGIGLTGSEEYAYPAWWSLVLLVPAVVAVVAVLVVPLARRTASIKVADALRFE